MKNKYGQHIFNEQKPYIEAGICDSVTSIKSNT